MQSSLQTVVDGGTARAAGHLAAHRGILLIAYHFPPSAAVGGRRIANFAASIRSLGWNARVLTIPDRAVEQLDPGRSSAVESIPVHVAPVWPTIAGLTTALSKLRRAGRGQPATATAAPPADRERRGETLRGRARRYFMAFALLPDGEKGWCIPAAVNAVRIIRRQRLPWFMTSCPPYSVHLIGLVVKLLTGAGWVADFRDPWMTTGSKRLFPTCAASLAIESWLERLVIEKADLVVFNVARLRDAYRARYAHVRPDKFAFIPNAIAAMPERDVTPPKFDRFTICYTGSLYVGRSPEPVFEAVSRLLDSGAVGHDDIRIMLAGQCRFVDGTPIDTVIRRHRLDSVVDVHDQVPLARAFDMVRRSHLALLLAPNLPYQIPAKAYDYLGAGTRILAIAEEGGTADLLNETGAGAAFAGNDVAGIAAFIRGEMMAGESARRRPATERYEAGRIAQDLVHELGRAAGRLAAEARP